MATILIFAEKPDLQAFVSNVLAAFIIIVE